MHCRSSQSVRGINRLVNTATTASKGDARPETTTNLSETWKSHRSGDSGLLAGRSQVGVEARPAIAALQTVDELQIAAPDATMRFTIPYDGVAALPATRNRSGTAPAVR